MRVVDLGCGAGELTRELHRKVGAAETIGVDGLRFERAIRPRE